MSIQHLHIQRPIRFLGYTLVELFLVLAVIGILLSSATLVYRTVHNNARLDRTALEIQNVLESAMAYNVDNGAWPAQNLDLATCSTDPSVITDTTFLSKYIPNQTTLSQLGYYYCWGPGPITQGTSSALFWVAQQIPHGDANMASQLAAKLPNGIVTQDPTNNANPACTPDTACYVRAIVATPSTNSSSAPTINGIYVAGFGECMNSDNSGHQSVTGTASTGAIICTHTSDGYCDASYNIPETYQVSFTCPSNTHGTLTTNPNHFYQHNNTRSGTPKDYPITELHTDHLTCSTEGTATTCSFDVYGEMFVSSSRTNINVASFCGSVGASYVALCLPN